MEFSAEEKAKLEAPLKSAMKSMVEAMELCASMVAQKSENKVDDVLVPMMSPPAKALLMKFIEDIKL